MNFNGDLSKYHPADAIMFLSQLSLNGVFSIVYDNHLMTQSFNNGFIIDAHSRRGDAKILQALIFHRRIDMEQAKHIRRIQTETGMPVRAILSQLNLFPLADVADILLMGMHEVVLEMFLLDRGTFNFTDTPVDTDDADTRLDARMLAIRVAAQSDEYRDFEKHIITLERSYAMTADVAIEPLSTNESVVLQIAAGCRSLGQLIERSPIDSFTAMEIVRARIEKGTIVPAPLTSRPAPDTVSAAIDPLFGTFRQALNTLVRDRDPLKQLKALVTYCKHYYDGMLILSAKNDQLVHCQRIRRQEGRGFVQQSRQGRLGCVVTDPIISAVSESGVGFFGEPFPSPLLESLAGQFSGGECALIPIPTQGAVALFFFAFTRKPFSGLSPQHYLELLSWMVTAHRKTPGPGDAAPRTTEARSTQPQDETPSVRLVAMVDELPPLPTLVTRALELLSDADASVKEIEAVIEKDQSLVSKLIRVSNSALYGGMQRVESLRQALTRLGAKTSRSLIVAASMQNYFLNTNARDQALGQALWQHAAECGLAARRIASTIGYDDPEKAFVGGIVHDIGKLVILLTSADAYHEMVNLIRQGMNIVEAENRIVGTDHVAVGLELMRKWKMPRSAQLCVAYHHRPDDAGSDHTLATIAAYADHLSHCFGAENNPANDAVHAEMVSLAERLAIPPEAHKALIDQVTGDFKSTGTF